MYVCVHVVHMYKCVYVHVVLRMCTWCVVFVCAYAMCVYVWYVWYMSVHVCCGMHVCTYGMCSYVWYVCTWYVCVLWYVHVYGVYVVSVYMV